MVIGTDSTIYRVSPPRPVEEFRQLPVTATAHRSAAQLAAQPSESVEAVEDCGIDGGGSDMHAGAHDGLRVQVRLPIAHVREATCSLEGLDLGAGELNTVDSEQVSSK